jgi:hypothetical protein
MPTPIQRAIIDFVPLTLLAVIVTLPWIIKKWRSESGKH